MSDVCLSASTPNAAKVSFGLKYTAADEVDGVSLNAERAGNSAMGSLRKGRRASPNCRRNAERSACFFGLRSAAG
jgi:hypothetical protein